MTEPTTQEAEKALESIEDALRQGVAWSDTPEVFEAAQAALRSLRTQHTERHELTLLMQPIGWATEPYYIDKDAVIDVLNAHTESLRQQHTKDREEIERLKEMLRSRR